MAPHCRRYRHYLSSRFVVGFDPGRLPLRQNVAVSNLTQIGRRIRRLRKDAKLTLVEAADAIGIGRSYLNEIELGSCRGGIEAMTAIADYFKVPFDWLLCRKVPPGGPLVGEFLEDPDELALVHFWRSLTPDDRAAIPRLLGIPRANNRVG